MDSPVSSQAAAPRRRIWLVLAIIAGLCLCAVLAIVVIGRLAWSFFGISTVTTSTATPGPGEPSGQAPQPAVVVQGTLVNLVLPGSPVTKEYQSLTASTAAAPLFLNKDYQTNSPSIALDAQGGLHLAYASFFSAFGDEPPDHPAFYAVCQARGAAACAQLSNWRVTPVSRISAASPWTRPFARRATREFRWLCPIRNHPCPRR